MPALASMLQVKDVQVGNVKARIAELTFNEGKAHIERGAELMKKGTDATPEEWTTHTGEIVASSFNRAAEIDGASDSETWDLDKLHARFGRGTLNKIYLEILVLSGLRLPEDGGAPGEAKAA